MNCSFQCLPIATSLWIACVCLPILTPAMAESPYQRVEQGQRGNVLDATDRPGVSTLGRAESASADLTLSDEFASRSSGSPFRSQRQSEDESTARPSKTLPLTTVFSSLAIVLGLFGGLVVILRRSGGASMSALNKDTLQVLGRSALAPRQNIMLVRCGKRILVLAVGGTSTTTLAEISDPDEVAEILAQCSGDSNKQFHQTLQALGKEKPSSDRFVDSPSPSSSGLFASR